MQPLEKTGVVHIGAPAVERCRCSVTGNRGGLLVAECGIIRRDASRVEKRAPKVLSAWQRVDIGDVALLAPAKLDANRVDQHEPSDPLEATHAHLERDPPAERGTDQNHISEIPPIQQVEIEVGEIVDGTEAVRPLGPTEAGMPGCHYPPAPGQTLEEVSMLREIVTTVQKKQRTAVSRSQRF